MLRIGPNISWRNRRVGGYIGATKQLDGSKNTDSQPVQSTTP